jgi:predicted TIM-barrel fold metal-dependent hydrolase
LFDAEANTYAFLDREDPTFRTIVGDYSALPRRYLPDDYLKATVSCHVEGLIWHEFLSADPVGEARWGQRVADASRLRQPMVVLVNFLEPMLQEKLEAYAALPNVVAVREHLGWDGGNALRRFATRPDLLTDPAWGRGLAPCGAMASDAGSKSLRRSFLICTTSSVCIRISASHSR